MFNAGKHFKNQVTNDSCMVWPQGLGERIVYTAQNVNTSSGKGPGILRLPKISVQDLMSSIK